MRKNARKLAGLSFAVSLSIGAQTALNHGICVNDLPGIQSIVGRNDEMVADSRAIPKITDEMLHAAVAVYETRDSRVELPDEIVGRILAAALGAHANGRVDDELPIKRRNHYRKGSSGGSED